MVLNQQMPGQQAVAGLFRRQEMPVEKQTGETVARFSSRLSELCARWKRRFFAGYCFKM
jgi:hypothetical protein